MSAHRLPTLLSCLLTVVALTACTAAPASPQVAPTGSLGQPSPVRPMAADPPAPTPSPTPWPTPNPTSAPDVASLFIDSLLDPDFGGSGPISGEFRAGAMRIPVKGTMAVQGGDSVTTISMVMPTGETIKTSSITADGISYTAEGEGPWFEVPSKSRANDPTFADAMAAAALSVKDVGVVEKLGMSLHRLSTNRTFTGQDLGMSDPSMRDAPVTVEFYARDDGRLVVLSTAMTWTMQTGNAALDASMTLDFVFDGDPAPIVPPDDVWVQFTSKRFHYTIGYPSDWTAVMSKSDDRPDVMAASSDTFATVVLERQPKAAADDLDAYAAAFIDAQKRLGAGPPDTDTTVTVLGAPCRRLTYRETHDGVEYFEVFSLVIRGRDAYQIGAISPVDQEADLLAFHELQVGTFALPPSD